MNDFYTVSFAIGAALGLLMSSVLLVGKRNQPANRFFAIGLILSILVNGILTWQQIYPAGLPFSLNVASLIFSALCSACIYYYFCLQTIPYYRVQEHPLVLVPFLVAALWTSVAIIVYRAGYLDPQRFAWETYLRGILNTFFLAGYLGAMAKVVAAFQTRIEDGTATGTLRLNWLRTIWILCLPVFFVRVMDILVGPHTYLGPFIPPLFTFAALGFATFALAASKIFGDETEADKKVFTSDSGEEINVLKRYLADPDLAKYGTRLEETFARDKLHMRQGLKLVDVAESIGIRPYLLSELLREHFKSNFFDYVNRQRVEEAKRMLVDPKCSHLSIIALAEEVGFNSKSVFNDAFKKHARMTPSEYRSRFSKS